MGSGSAGCAPTRNQPQKAPLPSKLILIYSKSIKNESA